MLPGNGTQKIGMMGLGALVLCAVGYVAGSRTAAPESIEFKPVAQGGAPQRLLSTEFGDKKPVEATPSKVVVHVVGAVGKPGMYEFEPGTRVNDALQRASVTQNANLEGLNLAAKLEDGDQLYVPRKTEEAKVEAELQKVNPLYGGGATAESKYTRAPGGAAISSPKVAALGPGSISLNTAGMAELDRLPGVGPSTAEKILAYRREHGGFATIDELMSVKGIGPKKLAAMRKYLRL